MVQEFTVCIYDTNPARTETFETDPEAVTTESTENGERITVTDGPDNTRLEVFIPKGTAYTLKREG
jgi:hypothetical protein